MTTATTFTRDIDTETFLPSDNINADVDAITADNADTNNNGKPNPKGNDNHKILSDSRSDTGGAICEGEFSGWGSVSYLTMDDCENNEQPGGRNSEKLTQTKKIGEWTSTAIATNN
ncbi:hypothetical protein HK100_000625 [Physocladia obscura]|uniref:Uncharacterized protein n=1 Tax=Physocladia obscura TaxID=109957 RepID=A0AAD5XBP1_9FUNG|nr:hypothetical protein HK100_000625 [Physocladia obscura]